MTSEKITKLIEKHLKFDIDKGIIGKEEFTNAIEKLIRDQSFKLRFPEQEIIKKGGTLRKSIAGLTEIAGEFNLKLNRGQDFNKACRIYKKRMDLP